MGISRLKVFQDSRSFFLLFFTYRIFKPEVHMRRMKIAWIPAILLFAGVAFGQIPQPNHLPFKDLVFAQLAAGGIWETEITVTNPGAQQWQGVFHFYGGLGSAWNPYVNGIRLSGGSLAVSIDPKTTATYKITSPSDVTEVGYVMAVANDTNMDSLIEGNLTWFVKSGATITDSIGVLPSNQFLVTTIPFEDFNAVSFAFANTDARGRTAHLKFRLYNAGGTPVRTELPKILQNREHLARYLREIFTDVTLGRGRVDIESDVPVSGVALIQTGSQFSSLPLDSTTRTYLVDLTGGTLDEARYMVLSTEGFFVKGYLEWREFGDFEWSLFAISGQIADGELHLNGISGSPTDDQGEWFWYLRSNGAFTLGQSAFSGTMNAAAPAIDYIMKNITFTATLVP